MIGSARWRTSLGVSERALRRRVTAAVGYGPKRLARVLRLRRALALAGAGSPLADAAYEAGYADQAHSATTAWSWPAWRLAVSYKTRLPDRASVHG